MRSPNTSLQKFARIYDTRGFSHRGSYTTLFALLLSVALLLGPFSAGFQVMAQDTAQRLAEAEVAKAEADAAKARIEAQQAEFDAKFPKPSSSPLAGTTTTNDTAFIEELIQGNKAVNATAEQIANDIYNNGALTNMRALVVQSPASINLLTSYEAGLKRIEVLKQAYDDISAEEDAALRANPAFQVDIPTARQAGTARRSIATALGAATSTVGSFVDLLSFFRTNVDIRGETFTVDEDVFVAALFAAINTRFGGRVQLYYPTNVPPNLGDPTNSEILRRIKELYEKKDLAESKEQEIKERIALKREQIEGLTQLIAEAKKTLDDAAKTPPVQVQTPASPQPRGRGRSARGLGKQPVQTVVAALAPVPPEKTLKQQIQDYKDQIWRLEQEISRLNRATSRLPGVNTQFTNLINDLLAVDKDSGLSLVTGYVLTEGLKEAMKDAQSYWLTLEVIKAGGNRKVQSNLIWDVFRGGAKVTHSGGAVVHFNVYDKKGKSIYSGIRSSYLPYRSARKI
ncbi:MAG TPA: hypothetical protein VJS44_01640 [Pyrinomonadaceae bacterium]|nr:hypothetical protein [Pyrinomonadaceae bacterium]